MKREIFKAVLLGLTLLIGGCQGQQQTDNVTNVGKSEELPDQEGWNSTLVSTQMGRVRFIVRYGYMARYLEKGLATFDQGVQVDFFNEDGSHASCLTADRAQLNEKTRAVEAMGHVVVVSDSGVTLRTEQLRWDDKRGRIITDQPVVITTKKDTLYGIGFESDAQLRNWVIKQPRGKTKRPVALDLEKRFTRVDTLPDSGSIRYQPLRGDSTKRGLGVKPPQRKEGKSKGRGKKKVDIKPHF